MKKGRGRQFLLVLLLIIGITGNTHVYATEDSAAAETGKLVVVEYVNIREKPTTDARILGHIPGETVLEPLGAQKNELGELWYQIRYEGITGYIRETTVVPQKAQEEIAEETVAEETIIEEKAVTEETVTEEMATQEPITQEPVTEEPAETETPSKQEVSVQTTREAVNPIDKAASLFFGGAFLCLIPIALLIKKIRKQQCSTDDNTNRKG